jgi:predicted RecA/RadA family phage recombinase
MVGTKDAVRVIVGAVVPVGAFVAVKVGSTTVGETGNSVAAGVGVQDEINIADKINNNKAFLIERIS